MPYRHAAQLRAQPDSKDNAYRSCKTGYKMRSVVPEILQTVANKFEDLRELLVDAKEELIGETFSIPSVAEEIEEEADGNGTQISNKNSSSLSLLTTVAKCNL